MLKIHFFTQIPLVFGNQQLLLVFLPKKESCESDFRNLLCPPRSMSLSFGKSSQISFGDHMQSQWGHHTRCHDANNWLIPFSYGWILRFSILFLLWTEQPWIIFLSLSWPKWIFVTYNYKILTDLCGNTESSQLSCTIVYRYSSLGTNYFKSVRFNWFNCSAFTEKLLHSS